MWAVHLSNYQDFTGMYNGDSEAWARSLWPKGGDYQATPQEGTGFAKAECILLYKWGYCHSQLSRPWPSRTRSKPHSFVCCVCVYAHVFVGIYPHVNTCGGQWSMPGSSSIALYLISFF